MSSPSPQPGPIRVVIIDDDAMARTGISTILGSASDIEVVGEGDDGDQAMMLVTKTQPDVVVMDVRMARVSGLDATRMIGTLPHPPKVVVVTSFGLDEHVFDALGAGAIGFLLKESSPADIIEAVRRAAQGNAMLAPQTTTTLIRHFVQREASESRRRARSKVAELSPREHEVLLAIAKGQPNAEIAGAMFLSEATVKTHLTRMYSKLDVTNRVQLAILAYAAGALEL